MDFGVSGSRLPGAIPSLDHIYSDMKAFAVEKRMYLHMSGLTRTLLNWNSSADYPIGRSEHGDEFF